MKPETAQFVEKALDFLRRANVMLTVDLSEDAARAAYFACHQMALALIFEREGKIVKTHKGAQIEFFRLTKDDPHADPRFRSFLSEAYEFKAAADYGTGSQIMTSREEALGAIETAGLFVTHVTSLIAGG